MLASLVSLHDIADVEGFVHATLNDSGIHFDPAEREELVAEGLLIMCELAAAFEPHRAGYDQPGRFSGYAAWALPKKLTVIWHRRHEEHRYITNPDGSRSWAYFKRTVSLDGMRAEQRGHVETGGGIASGVEDSIDGRLLRPTHWVPVAQAA